MAPELRICQIYNTWIYLRAKAFRRPPQGARRQRTTKEVSPSTPTSR